MSLSNRLMLFRNARGFTLPELIVVMAIFMTVLIISANAFQVIVNSSSQQSKSAETEIGGIVGLEVLRADLEHAGFGLPWSFPTTPAFSYQEADPAANEPANLPSSLWPTGADFTSYNDDATGSAPRAVLSGNTTFNLAGGIGSNYLVIKSTLADGNDTAKKWTTVSYDNNGLKGRKTWGTADRDFTDAERVIVVKNSLLSTPPTRQLMAPSSPFSSTFGTYSTQGLLNPHQNGDTFEIYGISPSTDLRMPFNRADYYVYRPPNVPKTCMQSSGVGILYKSSLTHDAGMLSPGMPLLDCVADMQVVYGLDSDGAGRVNQYLNAPATTAPPTAADIRNQLREIRVYILAQEGKRDLLYTYPSPTVTVGEVLNTVQRGRVFNLAGLGADYTHFRWKVYTIVVRPKNLVQ